MTEMYLWVGTVWYDACGWVSVNLSKPCCELCSLSTFVNTHDDEYNGTYSISIFSCKNHKCVFLFLTVCATMNMSEMSSYLSIHLLSHCSTSQFAVTNKTSVRQPWKLVGNPVARENCIPQPAGEWLPAVTSWNLLQNAHITEKNSLWLLWLLAHCSGQP